MQHKRAAVNTSLSRHLSVSHTLHRQLSATQLSAWFGCLILPAQPQGLFNIFPPFSGSHIDVCLQQSARGYRAWRKASFTSVLSEQIRHDWCGLTTSQATPKPSFHWWIKQRTLHMLEDIIATWFAIKICNAIVIDTPTRKSCFYNVFQKKKYIMLPLIGLLSMHHQKDTVSTRSNLASSFLGCFAGAPTHSLSDAIKSAILALLII